MKRRLPLAPSDLRGAARLATEATAGLADLVEAVHERVGRWPGRPPPATVGRTRGVSGLVYRSIRGVTRLVGGSVEALLGLLEPALRADDDLPEREAIVAALNGVLGDHLAATSNPLAIPMRLRHGGVALSMQRDALAAQLPSNASRVLVLLHGLCMNDRQWLRQGHDHGAALARDLGFTPLYLHYNTGLHVGANGRLLAEQLECLLANWPHDTPRLALLGHSMGGLVARSALHQAAQAGQRWLGQVDDLVCLGTPHHGAPLERAGHWIDLLLGAAPYAAPFARLGRLRSAGITDLRHGALLDTAPDQVVPLPAAVRCFALAATTGRVGGDLKDRLLGDGLVPLDSALGRHADPARTLAIPPERQWVGFEMNHLDLLHRPEVCAQLQQWLRRAP